MTNRKARAQLESNLWHYLRVWLYASERELSYSQRYLHRAKAAADQLMLSPAVLAALTASVIYHTN